MAQTLEQKIAEAENKLARLREQSRRTENGQKIILGGMLIHAARKDDKIRAWLLEEAERSVTREVDKKRLAPLLDILRRTPEAKPERAEETVSEALTNILSDNGMRD